jgi:hypothetical protein
MKTLKATLLLLALSLPLWAANHPAEHRNRPEKKGHENDNIVAVPEGGNTITYLLVSSAAIAGVLVLRKRSLSPDVNNG